MTYEADNQAASSPPRSRSLRRGAIIGACAVALVAGGYGVASAASTPGPSPSPSTPAPSTTSPCPHGTGGSTGNNSSGASYQL